MAVDALDPIAVQSHLDEVIQRYGRVSLMFNAISWDDVQGQMLSEMPFEQYFMPIRLGLTTWFHPGTVLAKHMAKHGGGTILGIAANAGHQPFGGIGGFGVACAAVEHYLRQLAAALPTRATRSSTQSAIADFACMIEITTGGQLADRIVIRTHQRVHSRSPSTGPPR
jgi:NAD(P)-dependent dehydrogenase (short-subunit alcohol dehydrogenase family)